MSSDSAEDIEVRMPFDRKRKLRISSSEEEIGSSGGSDNPIDDDTDMVGRKKKIKQNPFILAECDESDLESSGSQSSMYGSQDDVSQDTCSRAEFHNKITEIDHKIAILFKQRELLVSRLSRSDTTVKF